MVGGESRIHPSQVASRSTPSAFRSCLFPRLRPKSPAARCLESSPFSRRPTFQSRAIAPFPSPTRSSLRRGGIVGLCHVHEHALPNPPYAYDRPDGKLNADGRARFEEALRALVPIDAERRGITTHVTVIDGGEAAEAITQAAERLVVDAIVLASHGHGGVMQSILGSVSHAVVRRSRRPVLVVPSSFSGR